MHTVSAPYISYITYIHTYIKYIRACLPIYLHVSTYQHIHLCVYIHTYIHNLQALRDSLLHHLTNRAGVSSPVTIQVSAHTHTQYMYSCTYHVLTYTHVHVLTYTHVHVLTYTHVLVVSFGVG